MTDHLEVRPRSLTAHADRVDALGDCVRTAADAGAYVRPGPEACGKLCVLMPVMLGALQDVLVDGIGSTADSLHGTATLVRATADSYTATDDRRGAELRRIRDAR